MKCRMCVRGFEDVYKNDLDRYSGTSTRWGQRMVVATAIQSGWPMASLDISVAFLKGMSFDEVQKIRGGPRRQVSMQLPYAQKGMPSGVQLLRQFPGFEGFDDALEVLEMLKGGFGLVDAPNLFTSRADAVFRAAGIPPTLTDPKIYLKHKDAGPVNGSKQLVLMLSAHMDDFKATGETEELKTLHGILSKEFGADVKMDVKTVGSFIHTGVTHDLAESEISMHQTAYVAALRPVQSAELMALKDDDNITG